MFSNLLKTLNGLFRQRTGWLALSCIAMAMEAFALVLQHVFGVEPCNECVYIRVSVLCIALAGLLGATAPSSRLVRFGALTVLWGALAGGLWRTYVLLVLEHTVRAGGAPGCSRFIGFPKWLALDSWLPAVFEPRALCGVVDWTFLGGSVTAWSAVGLAIVAGSAALVTKALCTRHA